MCGTEYVCTAHKGDNCHVCCTSEMTHKEASSAGSSAKGSIAQSQIETADEQTGNCAVL